MRDIKIGDTFQVWFEKFNELITSGVVGSFSNDPDMNSVLDFYIRASVFRRGTIFVSIPATYVALTDNDVNIVYLDTTSGSEGIFSALSLPPSNAVSLYRVTTSGGSITLIEDLRSWLNADIIDHQNLINRDAVDVHPYTSITGLGTVVTSDLGTAGANIPTNNQAINYAIAYSIALGG
jgi:hypothetical protein